MHRDLTTPPAPPASDAALRAVRDAFEGLTQPIEGERKPELRARYEHARQAIASVFGENGAPREEHAKNPGATPSAGERQPAGGAFGERGIRTPERVAPSPDFESGFSPRAVQLAALAWELIDSDPKLAARVAANLVELDEHDPLSCYSVCCNSPVAIE